MANSLVIVTGASRGFGRYISLSLAAALAARGNVTLALWARDLPGLEETARLVSAKAPGIRILVNVVDLSLPDELPGHWRVLQESIKQATFSKAYLIQNAGSLGRLQALAEVSDYAWLGREVALNVTAPYVLASLFLRWVHGPDGPSHVGDSAIVNVSSLAAVKPFHCWGAYCAGKAARDMIHRCIATEEEVAASHRGGDKGAVRTLNYAPGPLDTEMQREIRDSETMEAGLRDTFAAMKREGALVDPSVSAEKCTRLLLDPDTAKWSSGDHVDFYDVPSAAGGAPVLGLKDPLRNKGGAYSMVERDAMHIRGLLPSSFLSLDDQVSVAMTSLNRLTSNLSRYEFLFNLLGTNATVFFAAMVRDTAKLMPIVYTPVVGEACTDFGHLSIPAAGMFISWPDAACNGGPGIASILDNWRTKDVRAIVVTDGGRILGLGDLGANGHGIPVGKLALYSALAGVNPENTLPITLDVGTDNAPLRGSSAYVGIRQPRPPTAAYDAFVDEFVHAVKDRFGPRVLLQWEDFGNEHAFKLSQRYKSTLPSYNDDIEGTAAVTLAGLMSATRITGRPFEQGTYLFFGAGEAGVGIANLIAYAMANKTGRTLEEERCKIWLVDSKGLIVKGRGGGGEVLAEHKVPYAHDAPEAATLLEAVRRLRPTTLIGVSAQPGAFTKDICEAMASYQEHPIIFSLSNPTSKAECSAAEAYAYTAGKAIFASGSPFEPVVLTDGSVREPGQGNNAYIFPAIGLATLAVNISSIAESTMHAAAIALADQVSDADLARGSLYPPLANIRDVSARVAAAVAKDAYDQGVAGKARPDDLEAYIRASMWVPEYK